jgi:amino acid adenylation domain-containing protein
MPVQVIVEQSAPAWRHVNLDHLSADEQEARIHESAIEVPTYDFVDGPLVDAFLFSLSTKSHVLLINLPALCADMKALMNLRDEVVHTYEAVVNDGNELDEPLQYLQFSEWQNELLADEEEQEGRAYWQQQNYAEATALMLPLEKEHSAADLFAPASQIVPMSSEMCDGVRELAGKFKTNTSLILFACWQILLSRLTTQTDFFVGKTFECRPFDEMQNAIGPFAKSLPICAHVEGETSFGTILKDLEATLSRASEWQEYFDWEDFAGRGDSEDEGFFIPFAFEFAQALSELTTDDVVFSLYHQHSYAERFKVKLSCLEYEDHLEAELQYDTSLFEPEDIRTLAEQFVQLVQSVFRNPELAISKLDVLTDAERQQILVEWNRTSTEFPSDKCVQQLFEEQVKRTPDAVAVVFGEERLTYADLNRRANQLAWYLEQRGVGADTIVGVLMERSVEMLVALLGSLKAGAAYLPLDPSYPRERLSFILEEAAVPVLLTQDRLAGTLVAQHAEVLRLDTEWTEIARHSEQNPECKVTPQNLAYVIYTSGSTGRPKGVMISHQGLVNYLSWSTQAYGVSEGAGAPVHSSIGFDLTITSLFAPLLVGRRVVFLREGRGIESLVEALDEETDYSFIKLTPAHLEALTHRLKETGTTNRPRTLIIGGEALLAESLSYWREQPGATRLINEYGPTETVVGCCVYEVAATDEFKGAVAIGKPIANTELFILDKHLRAVPKGVAGELYIGGAGVARGYLRRPELTAESFVPHPYSTEPGARLYKTGDAARYRKDGNIEFLGRLDQQVKIRGYRIELGEIEAVLGSHELVRAAVVVALSEGSEKRLIAFIVAAGEQGVQVGELRRYLRERLPDYMIPAGFAFLKALPLTPNGKIDRSALSADTTRLETASEDSVPWTQIEEMLLGMWSEVLRIDRVSTNDNFFELGGHSLLATQLLSRVREAFQVEVPLRRFFDSPTIKALSENLESELRKGQGLEYPPISVRKDGAELQLSYAQQRVWFVSHLAPQSAVYNISAAVRLNGQLNLVALEHALSEITRRHEILRAVFPLENGRPSLKINEHQPVSIPLVQLSELTDEEQEAGLTQLVTESARQPFDLTRGPLLRLTLFRFSDQRHVILLTMHHIISDGWSAGVLVREVGTLYEAFAQDRPSPLPELSIQYADFADWQRQWLTGEVLERQLAYWKQQLADVPVLELPADRPRQTVRSFCGAHHSFQLDRALADSLKQLSRREATTIFMTLMAGFKVLLHRYTGQDDISVGTPIAGRNRREIEGLIGFFINTLVLRTDLSGNPTVRELLRREREVAVGAYAHQEVPFEKLVEELHLQRNLSHTPLFQVMMVLQNTPQEQLELTGLTLQGERVESGTAKFDLTLTLKEGESGLFGVFEYNTDLFDSATIERMVGHYEQVLSGMVHDVTQPISRLPLLTPLERDQLVSERRTAREEFPNDKCLHEIFEEQARHTPDAKAVVFAGESLTYRELNERANQLAHRLQAQGVKADTRIGLMLERSLEMIVAVLGVLKAGGAYVPLDPSYPQERLTYLLEDAGVSVLLTQQQFGEKLDDSVARLIFLDREWKDLEGESKLNPSLTLCPQSLAYVIYTSGSTGRPKGVMVTHANVTRLFAATDAWFNFNERDVWTLFHSYAFDFSVWELWGALLYGGRLVVVPYWISRSPDAFFELLCSERVTVLNQTPSAFRQLIRVDESSEMGDQLALRLIVFGGEALELQSLKPWIERHGDEYPQLVNMYGITETTVHVTYRRIVESDLTIAPGSVIGEAIPDLDIFVLDKNLEPVPIGVSGQMFVGGAGLARGYLSLAELTAQNFIPHPFSNVPGARLYRTGDLARYLANGDLEYRGRIDEQVKIRGFRIELGEIEVALGQHPAVREALVLSMPADDGAIENRLVAYLVCEEDQAPTTSEVRSYLKEKLPEHMVPPVFMMLDAFPLTAHGKINRRALPRPAQQRPDLDEHYVAPQTAVEEILAAIWSQVIGIQSIGIHDNFFELGGDSIRSIQVSALARQRGLEVSVEQLFLHQTIHELAQVIASVDASGSTDQTSLAFSLISDEDRLKLPEDVEDAYPLAMLQAGMLFHSEYSSDTAIYHDIFSFHLKLPLDVETLKRAIQHVATYQPTLRTSFDLSNFSVPMQLVHRSVEIPLEVADLRHLSKAEQEDWLGEWTATEKNHVFDWSCAPLLRFQIHRRSDETFQFELSFHHAILDGWSVATLLTDLFQTYSAMLNGKPLPNEVSLASSYRDFVAAELEVISSEEARSYWREKLSDLTVMRLPRPALLPAVGSAPVGRYDVGLSAELSDSLKDLARQAAVPLKTVLLAAHLRAMSLLGGQTDVLTGVISHGRPEEVDGERILGLFLNTLPFRQNLTGGTWLELIQETFKQEQELYPVRRYPMAQLQKETGRRALFETAFSYIHFHVYQGLQEAGDIEVLGISGFEQTNFTFSANFRLDLFASNTLLRLDYNTAELSHSQIETIGRYYKKILEAIVSDPSSRYDSQDLLSKTELHQQLVEWNNTRREYRSDKRLVQYIEEQAALRGESIAVEFEGERLSYRELNERANQLAHYLRATGIGPETVVGILMERSSEMVVALLATLKAGGAYLPLDPTYPQERVRYMLTNCGVRVVLTQKRLVEPMLAGETERDVLCVDSEWKERVAQQIEQNPEVKVEPENLAYVIYTSGSTGEPKGAMNTLEALENRLLWMQEAYGLGPDDVVLQKTPYSFDVSVWEFFWPLMVGARLVVARPGGHQDSGYLCELIKATGVTTLHFVPSMLAVFVEEERVGECESLRLVISSGEALTEELSERCYERLKQVRLHNLYGPTEAAIDVSAWECGRGSRRGTVPIGRPIANLTLYILDEGMRAVPVGVASELYIGGVGVGRGYRGRAELTAERFIPHPYSVEGGARLYRTGDVARYAADGAIEYLGRVDHQVKVRGFRIELGEVEAALRSHAGVREAVVVARAEKSGARLVAYVVASGQEAINSAELRRYVGERLPEYMVPAVIVELAELPLLSNGKLNRRALPDTVNHRPDKEPYVAPRTLVEEVLAGIWSEVLGIEQVGINDNYFAVGGDSIRSLRIISLARQRGMEFSLQQLFRHQTIAELAAEPALTKSLTTSEATAPFTLIADTDRLRLPGGLEDAYPLTMLQAGMFYHMQLMPESAVYHNVNTWHLRAKFDQEKLEQATQYVVARHPVLRTSFNLATYSEPLQLVHTSATLPLQVEDLRHLSPADQDEALKSFIEAERRNRFDISLPPLLRFFIHRRTDETFQFSLTESHTINDGWSLTSTLAEIFSYYLALLAGTTPPQEPPLSVTFRDYVRQERMALDSAECRRYWDHKLADASIMKLPRVPASYRQTEGRRFFEVPVPISATLTEELKRVARTAKVPLKSVLMAAHLKVLSVISGQTDVMGGIASNGRAEEVGGDQVRGLFLNSLPIRLDLSDGTWLDLVRRAFEAEWEMLPYRRYPLIALQRKYNGQPLFETQFNYVHFHTLEGVMRSGEVEVLASNVGGIEETHFTLEADFGLNVLSSQAYLTVKGDATELGVEQIKAAASYYINVLEAIAREPLAQHNTVSLLSPTEQQRLLVEWNNTSASYPQEKCIQQLFEDQVERTPDALAIIFKDRRLTYGELNRQANQLAHYLRRQGVEAESRVGILMEYSVETVVSLLAIHKAGGAYVPIDSAYPKERIAFMLNDAQVDVLLTNSQLDQTLPPYGSRVVSMDIEAERIALESEDNLPCVVTADNLAYIIYTSGSTGLPKGAMLPHRGIVNCMSGMQEIYRLTERDRTLLKTPLSFDASVWEVFWPLTVGASVVVSQPGGQKDTAYLVNTIIEQQITTAYFVPSMLSIFLDERRVEEATCLKRVICGGESLPIETVQRFYNRLHAELHHSYGPTETSIGSSEWICERDGKRQHIPIGRPLANNQIYLLNQYLQPVPVGTPGELYIGGDGLARGYWNQPELTAEKFIPDLFSGTAGARLYKTGDLARYLPDGNLEFLGRMDHQVKIRGFRIELGEIESAIGSHPAVKEVVVMAREDKPGDKRLIAYVIAASTAPPTHSEFLSYLREKLPEHMIPAAFVKIDEWPLMTNGKVDRRRLAIPAEARPDLATEYVAPRTEVEQVVCSIWQQVLQVEKVGLHDHFFDLGGHSLRMLQVNGKLREAFNREISMVEMFQYPTVDSLAGFLSRELGTTEQQPGEERTETRKRLAKQQKQLRQAHRAGIE